MHFSLSQQVFRVALVSLALALVGVVGSAFGQPYGSTAKPVDITKWKATKFQGKVEAVGGGMVTALNFGKEPIFIYLAPQVTKQVSVKGTAEPSALKSGVGVRFAGKVDDAGVLEGTLADLYLITPNDPLTEFSLDEESEIEGVIAANDMKGTLKVTVNGVKKEQKGEKTIVLKRVKSITVKVAEDLKVNVDVRDPAMIRKEDSISVTGRIVKANNVDQPNRIVAESLIVEMATPYAPGKRGRMEPPKKEGKEPAGKDKADPFSEGAKQAEDAKGMKKEEKKDDKKDPAAKKIAAR